MKNISLEEYNNLVLEVESNIKNYTMSIATAQLMGKLLGMVRLIVEDEKC